MAYKVTMDDVRKAGYCGAGLKGFCSTHGLNLVKLVEVGWGPEDLEGVDDEHLNRVIEVAKARETNG
jgi:hypothetical protein